MNRIIRKVTLMFLTLAFVWIVSKSNAAEILLHAKANHTGTVIRLGDVADVSAATPEKMHDLSTTLLMPTPAPGTTQFLQRSQLRELLALRGVDTTQLIILGAKAVQIGDVEKVEKQLPKPAVKKTLRRKHQKLPLQTTLVTTRKIERGEFIRASDIEVRQEPGRLNRGQLHSLEEVVGLEASRNLPEGTVLYKNQVRKPLLVMRGETVSVFASTGGISVKTFGIARQDGALGDLVQVQTLDKKDSYTAYVTARSELEVYASGKNVREIASLESRNRSRNY